MTLSIRSDVTGGAILADGVEKIVFDSAGRVLFSSDGGLLTTGDFSLKMRASAPSGWVAGNGGTIGNVGSGATRANVDTLALFTLWWTDYTDAQLPILTSAGAASVRGASAAADWAALKRLTVFDVRDRVPRAAGTTQVNGTKLEATEIVDNGGNSGLIISIFTGANITNDDGPGTASNRGFNSIAASASNASLAGKKVRVASIGMLGCFKL